MGENNGLTVADALALQNKDNCNANDGMFGGQGAWWVIILILFFAFAGWGGNRYGSGNEDRGVNTVVIPSNSFGGYSSCCTPATQQGLTEAFNFNQLDNGQRGLERGLCDGFYTTNLAITNLGSQMQQCCCESDRANLQGFNNIQSAIAQTNYNLKDCCCETRESIMQSNFNNQSGFNNLSNQLASCCCDIGRGQEGIKYALAQSTCDILQNQDKNTDRIINHLIQSEMETLRNDLQSANFQLSQLSQTSNIINSLQPVPRPAYIVNSPYTQVAYNPYSGCGCNSCC